MLNKIHWLYLVGFFIILFLPLLSLPPIFSPPDWGKTIIFRIVFSILIFFFIRQILSKKIDVGSKFKAIPKSLKILLISLLGIFFLATLFSENIHFSFWGSPHRSGGFLNFAFYILLALMAYIIFKPRDWKKIWDFSFAIGILVGIVAILQKLRLFEGILIPYSYRPSSTIGGPIFLAIYLLLLIFLALSFAIKTKGWKKFFYLFCVLFFLFIVFLSGTRAAYFGGALGVLYFLFFYPANISASQRPKPQALADGRMNANNMNRKVFHIKWLKILTGVILLLGIIAVWWLNSQPELPKFINENKLLKVPAQRLLIRGGILGTLDARTPGWKVALQAFKDKPVFGYGPENFSIGFDKYYDPSLPYITQIVAGAGTGWWDRAHNFFLDISVTAGVPALLIYLSLFIVLFWQLQKVKKRNFQRSSAYSSAGFSDKTVETRNNAENYTEQHRTAIVCHGLQATFIAYLGANLFSFDTFSSYLISFLLIGYSLNLITKFRVVSRLVSRQFSDKTSAKPVHSKIAKYKGVILIVLLIILIWFIWVSAFKPLHINNQANIADYQSGHGDCPGAIARMEKITKSHSIVDHHIRLKYVDMIGRCVNESDPVQSYQLGLRAYEIMKENTEIMPTYTRNWIILGIYSNFLAEKIQEQKPEESQKYLTEADAAFEKAEKLSPKRQETFMEWVKTDLLSGQPEKAKEKAQQCIDINAEFRDCWWMLGIANVYLNEKQEANKNIEIAKEKGLTVESELSLLQIAKAYIAISDYQELIKIYQKLIKIKPKNPQYLASLATCYREDGDFTNARIYALKLLDLVPSSQVEVEAFLQTLAH